MSAILSYEAELLNVFSGNFRKIYVDIYSGEGNIVAVRKNASWQYKKARKDFLKNRKLIHYPQGREIFIAEELVSILDKCNRFKTIPEGRATGARQLEKISYCFEEKRFERQWEPPLRNISSRMEHVIEILHLIDDHWDDIE